MVAPANYTLRSALATCNPANVADVLKRVCLDYKETGIKVTASANAVAGELTRANPQALISGSTIVLTPPAASIRSLRVTGTVGGGGDAALGHRDVSDSGATPSATLAKISDDGATITLEGPNCTAAVVSYIPRLTDAELAAHFAPLT